MKLLIPSLLLFLTILSCQNQPTEPETAEPSRYPVALQNVFNQHGGLALWNKMQTLQYEIVKPEQNEVHKIHLKDRRDRINGANFTMGFDGEKVWLEADTTYKGNAIFYHNLMFYFYAMPFVLADDGTQYTQVDPLEFEGISYPGIKVSYDAGVGASPDDEYIIYYHPESFRMEWLGYTVTYFSKEKSTTFKKIKYEDWRTYNGVILPSSITWYNEEDGKITEPRNTVKFEKVKVSEKPLNDSVFQKTANAEYL